MKKPKLARYKAAGSKPWQDRILELRVEDHPEPLRELRRLIRVHEAYEHANTGDDFLAKGRTQDALREYARASQRAPEVEELKFWRAVTMLNIGRVAEGRVILKRLYSKNGEWKQLLRALPKVDVLKVDRETIRRLTK